MCPYYLDGDLTELESPVGDTRCSHAYRSWLLWLLCSFQGPPRGRLRRPVDTWADPASAGLSKLNSMPGLELGVMPRGARGAAAARGMRDGGWAGQVRSTF